MKPLPDDAPEIVRRYFELDAERDVDGIVAQFSDDATVIDEGEALGEDRYRVSARLEGNFPGATVDLNHDFTITNGLIRRLEIA